MSDHGTNFVGANREIKEIYDFLSEQRIRGEISDFCSTQNIQWKFIPERTPNLVDSGKQLLNPWSFTSKEWLVELRRTDDCTNSNWILSEQ